MLVAITSVGGGSLAKLMWPLAFTLMALFWCSRSPSDYIQALLWSLILSPAFRHYVDWRTSFSQTNPIMLAPYCVIFASSGPVLLHLINGRRYAPEMLLLILTVTAGVGISLDTGSIKDPMMAAMRWLAPVWCALYIFAQAKHLSSMRENVRSVFALAVPVVALYGIEQFVSILPWDAYFMKEAPIQSIGFPEPFLVRVFATMNSPGSLAAMLCSGLLLMLPRVRILIWVISLIALIFTTQRAALAAFLVALLALAVVGRDKLLRRNLVKLAACLAVSVILVLSIPAASKKLMGSVGSVTHLQDDNSAQERWTQYLSAASMLDEYKFGRGIGWSTNTIYISVGNHTAIDSGLLDIYVSLGVIGGSIFLFILFALLMQGWRVARSSGDPSAFAELATALFGIAQLPFGDQHTAEHGVFLYLALGLLLARPMASNNEATTRPQTSVPWPDQSN
ncbi:O-antigen ligase family protein [Lichenicoccus roseus]|uniref:O-antigen ligase-related domain-containing protein n=1 Tax=Lichenicoccus roseus TaxID=2683649 RepID=A0A5R9J4I4_9PROT|nr:O-antigen ligase family protein [Lichenicoccus roseus]TLU72535.1 hypothetical protein FE263_10800 [Lichenicoccus roseus]